MLSSDAPTNLFSNSLRSENTSSFSFELRRASLGHRSAIRSAELSGVLTNTMSRPMRALYS